MLRGQSPRERDEMVRRALARSRRRSGPLRSVWTAAKRVIAILALLLVLGAASLWGYHFFVSDASWDDAARMVIQDVRVAAECPDQPRTVWEFVQRGDFAQYGVEVADFLGADWPAVACGLISR